MAKVKVTIEGKSFVTNRSCVHNNLNNNNSKFNQISHSGNPYSEDVSSTK